MYANNPIESLASAYYSAIHKDLPGVLVYSPAHESTVDRRPTESEVRVYAHFIQTWSNTALGFDRQIAGQAFSSAYTTVIDFGSFMAVYYGGTFAYMVEMTPKFLEDADNRRLSGVSEAKQKYKVIKTHKEEKL